METKDTIKLNGLNPRHVAQIIRRNMITRTKPSGKTYNRKKIKIKFAD
jgi:hypothetical protein